jgi:hypothetical protein
MGYQDSDDKEAAVLKQVDGVAETAQFWAAEMRRVARLYRSCLRKRDRASKVAAKKLLAQGREVFSRLNQARRELQANIERAEKL